MYQNILTPQNYVASFRHFPDSPSESDSVPGASKTCQIFNAHLATEYENLLVLLAPVHVNIQNNFISN
jgi:hypothetical protein